MEGLKVTVWKILLIILVVVIAVLVGLYFWGKSLQGKYEDQQSIIDQHKQQVQIFVIDKKRDKIKNAKLPKQIKEQFPKRHSFRKTPIVIAKVGPQITTLLCDERVYKDLPTKKQVRVEIAGIFIVDIKGPRLNADKPKKEGWFTKLKNKSKRTG